MSLLRELEAVPALHFGAGRLLEAHRDEIEAATARLAIVAGRPRPPERDPLLLRLSELLLVAGLSSRAWGLSEGIDAAQLDPAGRRRFAFLRARAAARERASRSRSRLPVELPEVPFEGDGSPLDAAREAVLRAEAHQYAGRLPEAAPHWTAALAEPATGLLAEELQFEASLRLGSHLYLVGKGADAVPHLRRAAAIARRVEADRDEASVLGPLYHALLSQNDPHALLDIGQRAAELPADVPGALPIGFVAQLASAKRAQEGDIPGALSVLDEGIAGAVDRDDAPAYAAMVAAKARLLDRLGDRDEDRYFVFRALKVGQARLRRMGQPQHGRALDQAVAQLERQVGPDRIAEFSARLKLELMRPEAEA